MGSKSKKTMYSSDLLANETALVTGAGKGIGRECAVALVNAGAVVIAVARTNDDLETLHAELGDRLIPWIYDATSEDFLKRLAEQKEISILVNNLGTNKPEPFATVEKTTLDLMFDMNFRSVFRITQAVVKNMINQNINGSIVNISSQMGHVGSPNRSVYCATKHALEGLTKALGVELATNNIRVNSVAPTFVKTALTAPMLENKEFADFVLANIPMNKVATVEDVANSVVFLASDLSKMITGTSIKVDGGWTAQ